MRLLFAGLVLICGGIAAAELLVEHKTAAILWLSAGVLVAIIDELHRRYQIN